MDPAPCAVGPEMAMEAVLLRLIPSSFCIALTEPELELRKREMMMRHPVKDLEHARPFNERSVRVEYEFVVEDKFGGQAVRDYVFDFVLYQDVGGWGRFNGAFVAGGDDHYRFNVNLPTQRVQISTRELRNQCAGDTRVVLLRITENGTERVAENDNYNDSPCSTIDIDDLPRGDYRIEVSGADQVAVGPYQLFVGIPGVCGDGTVNIDEECDDGNTAVNDGCSATCQFEPQCGNGLLDVGEECDDNNAFDTDDCTNACTNARCGDGIVQEGVEGCDDGNAVNSDTCTNACTPARCGDGIVQDGVEVCDDGDGADVANGDFVAPNAPFHLAVVIAKSTLGKHVTMEMMWTQTPVRISCQNARCGDGIVGPNEQCDDGNDVDTDACTNACRPARCGDSIVGPNEQCDDGNDVNTDACTDACQNARCGDGIVGPNESCDDGDVEDGDGCSAMCAIEEFCGDGIVNNGEECDDENDVDTDACTNACRNARCGDGIVGPDEACDDGNRDNGDACTNTCTNARCGDGIVGPNEQCDDANGVDTDECTNACQDARWAMASSVRANNATMRTMSTRMRVPTRVGLPNVAT